MSTDIRRVALPEIGGDTTPLYPEELVGSQELDNHVPHLQIAPLPKYEKKHSFIAFGDTKYPDNCEEIALLVHEVEGARARHLIEVYNTTGLVLPRFIMPNGLDSRLDAGASIGSFLLTPKGVEAPALSFFDVKGNPLNPKGDKNGLVAGFTETLRVSVVAQAYDLLISGGRL